MTIRQEYNSLLKHLHKLQEELEAMRNAGMDVKNKSEEPLHRKLIADLQKSLTEKNKLLLELDDLRLENRKLLFEIFEVQEKLESAIWQRDNAPTDPITIHAQKIGARADLLEVLNAPPHRHLHFLISGIWLGERGNFDMDMRLAHHSGNAGIVIFLKENKPDHPFSNWPECGRDNGKPFTTIFLNDFKSITNTIHAAKTSALLVIEKSLQAIEEALRSDESLQVSKLIQTPEIEFWLLITLQLRSSLQRIDKNLHYDDVRCKPVSDDGIKFTLINASYGERILDRFAFVWPFAKKKSPSFDVIKFLNGKGNMPIFESWPTDSNGILNSEWNITLDPTNNEAFQGMSISDNQLLKRLVQEIPNFLYHYNIQNPDEPCDYKRLVDLVHCNCKKWENNTPEISFTRWLIFKKWVR
jgi:hypothetical protein